MRLREVRNCSSFQVLQSVRAHATVHQHPVFPLKRAVAVVRMALSRHCDVDAQVLEDPSVLGLLVISNQVAHLMHCKRTTYPEK